jgi:hypothetical protein
VAAPVIVTGVRSIAIQGKKKTNKNDRRPKKSGGGFIKYL